MLDFVYTYNPKYFNLSVTLKEFNDGILLNAYVDILEDLPAPIVSLFFIL